MAHDPVTRRFASLMHHLGILNPMVPKFHCKIKFTDRGQPFTDCGQPLHIPSLSSSNYMYVEEVEKCIPGFSCR